MANPVRRRRPLSFWLLGTVFAAFVLFLYGPMFAIFVLSFQGPEGGLTFPMRGTSLHWFRQLWEGIGVIDIGAAFRRSLALGTVVMALTVGLSLLAGLDAPSRGVVRFEGEDIATSGYAKHRREHVSLVFQDHNLIDYLTPEENLRLVSAKADMKILEELGLSREESKRNIMHLSGGQRQRVAVGRALVAPGRAILADEPTGSLDPEMTDEVIHLLQHAAHQLGKCVIVVTHSKRVANSADVVLRLRSKKLTRA